MEFYKKYRKWLVVAAIAVIATAALVGGGLFKKTESVTATNSDNSAQVNGTMMQYFEWDLAADGTLWNKAAQQASALSKAGFTALWLPPAYKGTSSNDVGYGPYDLYDLGEFNQKGTTRTKYGTKAQYLNAINALHNNGIQVYADIVLNHKASADGVDQVNAVQVNSGNRNYTQSGTYTIGAWTKFEFAGRGNKYSSFKWDASCFDGVDYDNNQGKNAVFKFDGKNWDWQVDTENGNYDYLMYADVDFDNQSVVDELKTWGKWYVETANLDGFRLDAVKHIKYSFFKDWLTSVRSATGKNLFSVGEYWSGDIGKLNNYIDVTEGTTSLFDVPLHNNFYAAANGGGGYDMRNIFSGTLVACNPACAVTFVDNHDTQPGQSLQSFVPDWFKPLAYTMILTRESGYPCVFYGDYYGLAKGGNSFKSDIDKIMEARTKYAYGTQHDYLNDANIIGWTREGNAAHSGSGLAALVTDGAGGSKYMYVGTSHSGEKWYDITGHVSGTVTINSAGYATFKVNGGSNSIWVPQQSGSQEVTTTQSSSSGGKVTIYYKSSWSKANIHYQIGSGDWTAVPGVAMSKADSKYYTYTVDLGSASKLTACFNNGSTWDSKNGANYSFTAGTYTVASGSISSGAPTLQTTTTTAKATTTTAKATTTKATTTTAKQTTTAKATTTAAASKKLTIYYKNNWTNTYAHYKVGSGSWTSTPGVKMTDVTDDYAKITIDMGTASTVTACFNNGGGTWDSRNGANYSFSSGTYTLADGTITSGEPNLSSSNIVTVYYKNSWSKVYAHYKIGSGSWTSTPGIKMTSVSSSYDKIEIDLGTAKTLTICFNNGSGRWDSKNGANYSITAPGTYTIRNQTVYNGKPAISR